MRQLARFEAILAMDANLGVHGAGAGTDVFVSMSRELDCSVEQVANAYLGCVTLVTGDELPCRAPGAEKAPPPPQGTTYALWRALGGA